MKNNEFSFGVSGSDCTSSSTGSEKYSCIQSIDVHLTQLWNEAREWWPKLITEPSNDKTSDEAQNGVKLPCVVAIPRYVHRLSSTVPPFLPWPKLSFRVVTFFFIVVIHWVRSFLITPLLLWQGGVTAKTRFYICLFVSRCLPGRSKQRYHDSSKFLMVWSSRWPF